MILAFCASGCVNATPGSLEALCDSTRAARAAHADALAVTADENVLRTGAALVTQIDAGCGNGL